MDPDFSLLLYPTSILSNKIHLLRNMTHSEMNSSSTDDTRGHTNFFMNYSES